MCKCPAPFTSNSATKSPMLLPPMLYNADMAAAGLLLGSAVDEDAAAVVAPLLEAIPYLNPAWPRVVGVFLLVPLNESAGLEVDKCALLVYDARSGVGLLGSLLATLRAKPLPTLPMLSSSDPLHIPPIDGDGALFDFYRDIRTPSTYSTHVEM